MLIGFLLLVSACGYDACDALPVSKHVYLTQSACEKKKGQVHHQKPEVMLFCQQVQR